MPFLHRGCAPALGIVVTCMGASCAVAQGTVERPAGDQRAAYEVVTRGVLATPRFAVQFRSADVRLDINDLIMGPGTTENVPLRGRTLMELRGGTITTTIDGARQDRRPGEFWVVEAGARLSITNPGDVAVIRAIHLTEGKR